MATQVEFKVTGAAELLAALRRLQDEFPGAVAAAVYIEAITIMRRSQPLVPVDTSALLNSAWVSLPDPSSPRPRANMGYDMPYALPVHERTEVFHPHGQANFLRQPFEQAMAGYAQRVLARALQFVKQGVNAPSPDSRIPTAPPPVEHVLDRVHKHLRSAVRAGAMNQEEATRKYSMAYLTLKHHRAKQAA